MLLKRDNLIVVVLIFFIACSSEKKDAPSLDHNKIAKEYYGEDYQWYVDNLPFFECSDKQIEQVYYYRWKLYKAHLRNVGKDEYVVTEFINHVPWDRHPYCTINAASMHHIYEGRWLKDQRYMNGYIDNLYSGGNNRGYSESIADATLARYMVDGDSSFLVRHLDSMKAIYDAWNDHYDSSKNLYYIPAMPDATEYTIASIDASGGKDGFEGGDAFRPTLNSYMYGNAKAIAHIAEIKGDKPASSLFSQRANELQHNVEQSLWNDSLQHFTDRYKVNNQYVKYWDFIRGRELAGMMPWYFNLPSDNEKFSAAWKHVTDTNYLLGQYGFRTNEPSYEHYFKQFVFFEGRPGSQWNGPSWPYQSSQALTAMANVLNNYHQNVVTKEDYTKLLRLYTKQHFLPDGKINLVENYDPNKGGPIVYYYWSNHYLHSSFNNLVISGLCGIRPSESDTLIVNPLVDSTIDYFMLDDVTYHGHKLSVVYDRNGTKYNLGKGLNVFVNDEHLKPVSGDSAFIIPKRISRALAVSPENYALNIDTTGFPKASASINADTSMWQAVDGKIWYFPEILNFWSTKGSKLKSDWYAVEFDKERNVSSVKLYFFGDSTNYFSPDDIAIEYLADKSWMPLKIKLQHPAKTVLNTVNTFSFDSISAKGILVNFKHSPPKQVAISEIECY